MSLIVIEGVDASGKATQTELLYERLQKEGRRVRKITFPDYESESSGPVRLYLSGALGDTADSVDPYAASALFAVDRYCSYRRDWKAFLDGGGIVLADRYVTSNFIHQATKIADPAAQDEYLTFQAAFEYGRLGLPEPSAVIFLDVPPDISAALIAARENKFDKDAAHDIHERDEGYRLRAYNTAKSVAGRFGFRRIDCTAAGALKTREAIADEVYAALSDIL